MPSDEIPEEIYKGPTPARATVVHAPRVPRKPAVPDVPVGPKPPAHAAKSAGAPLRMSTPPAKPTAAQDAPLPKPTAPGKELELWNKALEGRMDWEDHKVSARHTRGAAALEHRHSARSLADIKRRVIWPFLLQHSSFSRSTPRPASFRAHLLTLRWLRRTRRLSGLGRRSQPAQRRCSRA